MGLYVIDVLQEFSGPFFLEDGLEFIGININSAGSIGSASAISEASITSF